MDLQEVRRRLAAHWGVPVQSSEVYVEHHERVVFRTTDPAGRRVVVKADVDGARLAREAAVLHGARHALPLPGVLVHLPGLLVMSWVDGEPLGSESPDDNWVAAGRALRRLHDEAPTDGVPGFAGSAPAAGGHSGADAARVDSADWWGWFHGWLPERHRRCAEQGLRTEVTDRLFEIMAEGFASAAEPPERLLHGDAASYHWRIRDDGTAAAIDFSDACVGDPLWDLVVLVHWDEPRLPAVLHGYGAGPHLRHRAARLFEPYRVARHLLAVDWLIEHHYDPTPTLVELTRIAAVRTARTGG